MADGVDYKVSNEATFDSPEEEEKARKACNNNKQCLLDVALVGDLSIANAFNVTQTQVAIFKVFNEVFHSNVPNETLFQEVIEKIGNNDIADEVEEGMKNQTEKANNATEGPPSSGNGREDLRLSISNRCQFSGVTFAYIVTKASIY